MKKIIKWTLIGLGAFFGLMILAGAIGAIFTGHTKGVSGSPNSTPSTTSSKDDSAKEKKWTGIFSFKGNGTKKSASFTLNGGTTRVRYKFTSDSYGGVFAFYVVPEGEDVMKTGGVPEVMTQRSDSTETFITEEPGNYYLDVNSSGGSWSIIVEEE